MVTPSMPSRKFDLPIPVLRTERLTLTILDPGAAPRVATFVNENVEHFKPWDPPLPEAALTVDYWTEKLASHLSEFHAGHAVRLAMLPADDPHGEIIGTCALSQIARGPFQHAFLGYKIAARHEGAGLMREALAEVVRYAFEDLRLHRISANYMPHNVRSGHVLNRLGFRVEGQAKEYLFINGAWRDHVLTSLTNPKFGEFTWY